MLLKDVAVLLSPSARSQAYVQAIARAGLKASLFLLLAEDLSPFSQGTGEKTPYFDRSESIVETLEKSDVPYRLLKGRDINAPEIAEALAKLPQNYIVYSGYGGAILKPHLFRIGKQYLHVHAGMLPQYRGSTTAYYSILTEGMLGASAIFLNERLDEGAVVARGRFPMPADGTDIDYVYEPWLRAEVLVKALRKYGEQGKFLTEPQASDGGETYFIIHPVLKHLALMKVARSAEGNGV